MNISQVVPIAAKVFTAPLGWLSDIFNSIQGATQFYMACFALMLAVVMFIMPLRGAGIRAVEAKKREDAKNSRKNKTVKEDKSG